MGWENVNLKDVTPEVGFAVMEAGDYDYQILPGAKLDDRNAINMQLSIASDGPHKGRRVFISYPDPGQPNMGWSLGALKRLEQAVGIDQDEGEGILNYAQRLGDAFAKFNAPLVVREYQNSSGETVKKNDVKLFKVKPAA